MKHLLHRALTLIRQEDGRDPAHARRRFLHASLSLAALSMLPSSLRAQQVARVRFVGDPFTLGVASGYPVADGATLWTRLAPLPLQADGGMARDEIVTVTWQVAEDESFSRIVASGQQRAVPELAHSVHVDVRGLRPGRTYAYRFIAGDDISPTGRTLTAPAPGSGATPLRFAIGSCQHYEQGYYHAYRHLIEDAPDLMVFLGDYIYESSWGDELVRRHSNAEPIALEDYRIRHAQYKRDPLLQRAHAAMPWLVVWDDHEVDNDLAGERSEYLDPRFLLRRAAAYQAYYEHMPLPATMRPRVDGGMRLHTVVDWGDTARIFMLDGRQYRTSQACPDPLKGGGGRTVEIAECAGIDDPRASLLGMAQERWLYDGLATSRSRWNVMAQQTLMSARDDDPGPARPVRTDGWDGYPRARQRLYDTIARLKPSNPLVVGGDIHATVLADLKRDPWDPRAPAIASEVCGTSITSQGAAQVDFDRALRNNPHFHFARSDRRGYCLLTLDRDAHLAIRALDTVKARDAQIETLGRFTIENGRAGLQPN
jgi:alkaline phosphatase D